MYRLHWQFVLIFNLPMLSVTCTICMEAFVTLVAVTVLIDILCSEGREGGRGEGGREEGREEGGREGEGGEREGGREGGRERGREGGRKEGGRERGEREGAREGGGGREGSFQETNTYGAFFHGLTLFGLCFVRTFLLGCREVSVLALIRLEEGVRVGGGEEEESGKREGRRERARGGEVHVTFVSHLYITRYMHTHAHTHYSKITRATSISTRVKNFLTSQYPQYQPHSPCPLWCKTCW